MTHFSTSVEIPAPPELVWAVLSDIELWSDWTPSVTRVQRLDQGPLSVGSRARIRQPRLLPATWQVVEVEPGCSFTWFTRSPGVRVTGEHRVEPAGRGARAILSLRFSGGLGPLVARLTGALNRRYLALEAKGLRERCVTLAASNSRSGAA